MRPNELCGARLLFERELRDGSLTPAELDVPAVRAAVAERRLPSLWRRRLQWLALRVGWRDHWRSIRPLLEARRAVLGAARAGGEPRLLIRVDEFPHARATEAPRYGTDAFARFDAILAEAGVPYLIAVPVRVVDSYMDPDASGSRPLDDDEWATLQRLHDRGVAIGLHHYDHRTRDPRRRRPSALAGLPAPELEGLIESAQLELIQHGLPRARVFVPPFNRFDPEQYPVLAARFDVVCGGPETVEVLGWQPTPAWRGDAVYLPSYPPLYRPAGRLLEAVERLVDRCVPLWSPITLHWSWEQDDGGQALRRLVGRIASLVRSWDEFLAAVDRSGRAETG
jgi:peptidoglycan/xylan/chitin deacetylase (PgdA/CDA1 family)